MAEQELQEKPLEIQIRLGKARPEITYYDIHLIPKDQIDRSTKQTELRFSGKDGPFSFFITESTGTLPVLHKSDKAEPKDLPAWQYVSYRYPDLPDITKKAAMLLQEIDSDPFRETYFGKDKKLHVRYLHEIDDSDQITEADLAKIGIAKVEKSLLDEVLVQGIKASREPPQKSEMQKEGARTIQILSEQVESAIIHINYCSVPPLGSGNPMHEANVKKWIKNYIEGGCINEAQLLVNSVMSLAKYTKYDEDFFGITEYDVDITIKNVRTSFSQMRKMKDIKRVTIGLDSIVKGIAIILPAKEEIVQRKIMEPSLPGAGMKTSLSNLTG